jgi:hypothetical protein
MQYVQVISSQVDNLSAWDLACDNGMNNYQLHCLLPSYNPTRSTCALHANANEGANIQSWCWCWKLSRAVALAPAICPSVSACEFLFCSTPHRDEALCTRFLVFLVCLLFLASLPCKRFSACPSLTLKKTNVISTCGSFGESRARLWLHFNS